MDEERFRAGGKKGVVLRKFEEIPYPIILTLVIKKSIMPFKVYIPWDYKYECK